MESSVDRLAAIDRALDDVRYAQGLLPEQIAAHSWRGPARSAFDEAAAELLPLLRSAEAALERERARALILLAERA